MCPTTMMPKGRTVWGTVATFEFVIGHIDQEIPLGRAGEEAFLVLRHEPLFDGAAAVGIEHFLVVVVDHVGHAGADGTAVAVKFIPAVAVLDPDAGHGDPFLGGDVDAAGENGIGAVAVVVAVDIAEVTGLEKIEDQAVPAVVVGWDRAEVQGIEGSESNWR